MITSCQRSPGIATLRVVVVAASLICCVESEGLAATEVLILSPDRAVQLKVFLQESHLRYEVAFHRKPVVETSPLTISVDGAAITERAEFGDVERYQVNETYPSRGVHSRAANHCNGAKISLRDLAGGGGYTLEARVFNDGLGFRYSIPGNDTARIPDEATGFILPEGSTVWSHNLRGHYEGEYEQKDVSDLEKGTWAAPPVTFKLPGGAGYASITEAALVNYSGMALRANGRRGFDLALGHQHPISYPFELRYKEDIERVSRPATVSGTITSPWRVVLVGSDLNALVNSDVIHNLCPPPAPQLFPEGINTQWIKPGRAVWRYLDGGDRSLEGMKQFSRVAGELGFQYHVIEGFWSRWSDEQIKELVDDSRQHGVGLFFWIHSNRLRTPAAREEFFGRLSRLGVVGAKIDFFDHEHREVVDLYPALLKEAAKHKILVNFHGSNKPTGDDRTWPNELARESVRGMESSRLQQRARHDAILPFTRFLAGPADYTPVHFGQRRADTTWAHQIATAAVFTAPLLTYAAHPETILANPGVAIIKSIPAVWDETIVLPVSEIGQLAAFARRSGDTWFLAIVNGSAGKTVSIPLSFLGAGEYGAMLIRDREDDAAALKIENTSIQHTDSIEIKLNNGGGFIGRFSRL